MVSHSLGIRNDTELEQDANIVPVTRAPNGMVGALDSVDDVTRVLEPGEPTKDVESGS